MTFSARLESSSGSPSQITTSPTAAGATWTDLGTVTTVALATVTGAIDAGGATSFEVPNGAGGTTVNAAGEVCVDTTSDTFNFYDGTEEKDKIIFGLLDDFQQYVPDFADKMKEYILDTKIQHICFYFPECPKCHTEPKTSYQGYIPYDPMHAFFTLALMKLLQGASTHDTPNT